jgi:hypothetical protein
VVVHRQPGAALEHPGDRGPRSPPGAARTLPVHAGWVTATLFTLANAALLGVRLRVENTALSLAVPEPAP